MKGWQAARFEELDSIPLFEGLVWHPVRKHFGIRAFGVNAYTTGDVGEQVVEEHDETGRRRRRPRGALRRRSRGRATFTIGGETQDAPAGTFVFIGDPSLRRKAIAEEDGTVVLAVGGGPGKAYEVSAWEWYFSAMPAFKAERWDEAIAIMEDGLAEKPGHPAILYNLACAESRGGRPLDALTHLQQAVRGDAKWAERAKTDPDFDPIRREPGFPELGSAVAGQAHAGCEAAGSAGTGSLSGRATRGRRRARRPASSASTSSWSPTASAKALCACAPPNGASSSSVARPASTSP